MYVFFLDVLAGPPADGHADGMILILGSAARLPDSVREHHQANGRHRVADPLLRLHSQHTALEVAGSAL